MSRISVYKGVLHEPFSPSKETLFEVGVGGTLIPT